MSLPDRIFTLRWLTAGVVLGSLPVILFLGMSTMNVVIMVVAAVVFAATFVIPHEDKD